MKSYVIVVGARPNFVKVAPLLWRASEYADLQFTLIHTGQHFDANMSQVFFDQMGIPKPNIQLDVQATQSSEKMGKMITALQATFTELQPDGVIVIGDINSTLAGAVAATAAKLPLLHIESGLRSHDQRMPEETNRVITDHLADRLFVTEQTGVDNLLAEGIASEKISLVGNLMIESIELFRDTFDESSILERLDLRRGEYVVATLHRVEHTSDKKILITLLQTLSAIAKSHTVVLPLHPGTKKRIVEYKAEEYLANLKVIEPLGYIDFMKLMIEAKGVVTDSGGIQEETSHLGIPCCTLRDNTERPVTLVDGTNKLFPVATLDANEVLAHLDQTFTAGNVPLWDAEVSKRILELL